MALSTGYTIFVTYQFENAPATTGATNYGYSTPIHCNYIQSITTERLNGKALNLFFPSIDVLTFLADSGSTNGTGFTATKLNAIVQVVNGVSTTGVTINPTSSGWTKVDITDQIEGHVSGTTIDKNQLINTLFTIEFVDLTETYTLDYLNYPSNFAGEIKMGFGEEAFFFGTVRSDIKATVYTTDIPVVLPLNSYNSSTNETWDGVSSVAISEIGIYDDNNNLVAIGKLNHPISKDSSIARTIAFQLDF